MDSRVIAVEAQRIYDAMQLYTLLLAERGGTLKERGDDLLCVAENLDKVRTREQRDGARQRHIRFSLKAANRIRQGICHLYVVIICSLIINPPKRFISGCFVFTAINSRYETVVLSDVTLTLLLVCCL